MRDSGKRDVPGLTAAAAAFIEERRWERGGRQEARERAEEEERQKRASALAAMVNDLFGEPRGWDVRSVKNVESWEAQVNLLPEAHRLVLTERYGLFGRATAPGGGEKSVAELAEAWKVGRLEAGEWVRNAENAFVSGVKEEWLAATERISLEGVEGGKDGGKKRGHVRQFLSVAQCAEVMGVPAYYIYRAIGGGSLPAYRGPEVSSRIGGIRLPWRIKKKDFRRWIEGSTESGARARVDIEWFQRLKLWHLLLCKPMDEKALDDAVADLPEHLQRVLVRRWGLASSPPATLQEVSEEMDVTRERVRQLQKEAERMLRRRFSDEHGSEGGNGGEAL